MRDARITNEALAVLGCAFSNLVRSEFLLIESHGSLASLLKGELILDRDAELHRRVRGVDYSSLLATRPASIR